MSSNSSGTALVAAVDLGATSGRVVLAEVGPDRLELRETARFANGPLRLPSGLHWNLPSLYAGALGGLRAAGREAAGAGGLASVGIDAWAVDYGLVRGDRLLGLPFHYRDERRCAVGPANVHALVGQDELYARNGLQFLPFNTAYQLAADPWTELADRMLLVPDLVAWWLTGRMVAERTNASTTGLLDPRTGSWDGELLDRLGVPAHLLPDLVDPGTTIGAMTDQVAGDTGLPGVPVVAVGSHDTASAVVGAPLGEDAAYLSLGTWGLVGVELADPVVTDAARVANFTNEGGVDGRTRFLTNVMGTWILSEALRAWDREDRLPAGGNDLTGLLSAAAEVDPASVPVVDVQDPRFLPPGDMGERVAKWCVDHDLPAPATRPAMVRTILESLAEAYAAAVDTAARLTGRRVETVHVVGGGSQNRLLCQAIADRSGRHVVAGPVEATALGNVLVQARAAGVVGPDLAELRALVARTHDLPRYEPRS